MSDTTQADKEKLNRLKKRSKDDKFSVDRNGNVVLNLNSESFQRTFRETLRKLKDVHVNP